MAFSFERELDLDFFHKEGFSRRTCRSCKHPFWTLEAGRDLCGDAPCVEYGFIGKPLTKARFGVDAMRERFLAFFESHGHTRVARYPVVARWREDIYLTIASIADFQPFVTSGEVPPPANPLAISQPCIRLNDLASVGRSGRHLTLFEMMAHHAFNSPEKKVYWANETVAFADEFLAKSLGIDRASITYKENPWAGGGNAGPALEVLTSGLEVATLVFMSLRRKAGGPIDIKGDRYEEMPLKVVDTGWGLERLAWASQGAPTVYDAVLPDLLQYVRANAKAALRLDDPKTAAIIGEHARRAGVMNLEVGSNLRELRSQVAKSLGTRGIKTTADDLERLMAPIEDLFALADHARCLAFMLGDGIVPSNTKAGYLARLIIRRTLRLRDSLNFGPSLKDLVLTEIGFLSKTFPELRNEESTIAEMLDLEASRFADTIDRGRRLIASKIERGQKIGTPELIELYDSQGLHPAIVREAAEPLGVKVDIPDAFDALVAERHGHEDEAAAPAEPALDAELPPTRMGYYETPEEHEFDASVLWSDAKRVVLDRTLFYPEGGGQPHDLGTLQSGNTVHRVTDVQRRDGVILHAVEGKIKAGEVVHGRVDWDRRTAHMRHHTATHIVNGAIRAILGDHAWQTGAQKAVDHARIDVTHFKRPSEKELAQIEALANDIVMSNIRLDRGWLERDAAEKRYGVRIYQGGVAPGRNIRIIRIGDHDVEACGGTHVAYTSEVGPIKILKSERIQDGVERITFAAGPAALEQSRGREALLLKSADVLSVPPEKLPEAVERFFKEWKAQRKEIEDLRTELGRLRREELVSNAERIGKVRLVVGEVSEAEIESVANALASEGDAVAVLGSIADGRVRLLVARSKGLDTVDAGRIVREAAAIVGGSGGGRPEAASGGGTKPEKLAEALAKARELVRKALPK